MRTQAYFYVTFAYIFFKDHGNAPRQNEQGTSLVFRAENIAAKGCALPPYEITARQKRSAGATKFWLNALYIPEVIYRYLTVPVIRIYGSAPTEQILYFFKTTQDADKICRINGQTT